MSGVVLCLFALAVVSADLSAGCGKASPWKGTSQQQLDFDDRNRDYYITVPSGYKNNQPLPLLLAFHGWTLSCTNIALCGDDTCDLATYANSMGYVFVSVCGYGRSFNAGQCCSPANLMDLDDVGLARELVETISSSLCIDTDKVWATGFSNGAMFSEVLACQASDVFSAVASVAGVVEISPGGSSGYAKCRAAYAASGVEATSVLMVHGSADLVVPWVGNPLVGYPSIPDNLAFWATENGCSGSGTQTYNNGDYTNTLFNNCDNNVQVELLRNAGGGHTWPRYADFDTTKYVLQFFARVSGWTPWTG